jgi:hypothetical protein
MHRLEFALVIVAVTRYVPVVADGNVKASKSVSGVISPATDCPSLGTSIVSQ